MQIVIEVPEEDIPKRQEIKIIEVHFIDGQVCGCTYPYEVNELDKIRAEIANLDDAEYEIEGYYKAVQDVLQIIDKYR